MVRLIKENESFDLFQNDWNDLINAVYAVNPKTNSGRILKGKIEKLCTEYIRSVKASYDGESLVEESLEDHSIQELADLVKQLKAKGVSDEDIRKTLQQLLYGE